MKGDWLINTWMIAFLNGISLASWWFGFSLMAILLPLGLALWLFIIWPIKKQMPWSVLGATMAVALMLGILRFALVIEENSCRDSGQLEKVVVQGTVAGFPQIKGMEQELLLDNVLINKFETPGGRLIAKFSTMQEVYPGDGLLFTANLMSACDSSLPRVYRQFLLRQSVNWVGRNITDMVVEPAAGVGFLQTVWWLRQWFNQSLASLVAEPAASLLAGILIGERGNLPPALSLNFQITGLTHILAISGFNITLIINIVVLLASSALGKKWRLLTCLLVIGFFVILTGASASVIRAGVMGLLALAVKTFGRKIPPLKLILMSVFLIVVVDPTILNFDLSFQLSLMATLSLIYFADQLSLETNHSWQQFLWDGVKLTLAAQILTLPLIFFGFGKISLISPIANLLIGPLIPFLMLLGAIIILLLLIVPALAIAVAGVVEILVYGMQIVINFLADLPLAQIEIGEGNCLLVIFYYLAVFKFFHKRKLALNSV